MHDGYFRDPVTGQDWIVEFKIAEHNVFDPMMQLIMRYADPPPRRHYDWDSVAEEVPDEQHALPRRCS